MAHKATLEIRVWTEASKTLPEDLPEALAPHVAHVKNACDQGYLAGEIIDERFDGWWEIKSQ